MINKKAFFSRYRHHLKSTKPLNKTTLISIKNRAKIGECKIAKKIQMLNNKIISNMNNILNYIKLILIIQILSIRQKRFSFQITKIYSIFISNSNFRTLKIKNLIKAVIFIYLKKYKLNIPSKSNKCKDLRIL
jgi:hypothetical protein